MDGIVGAGGFPTDLRGVPNGLIAWVSIDKATIGVNALTIDTSEWLKGSASISYFRLHWFHLGTGCYRCRWCW
jgi:hypothetical protein